MAKKKAKAAAKIKTVEVFVGNPPAEKQLHVNCVDCVYWNREHASEDKKGNPIRAECRRGPPVVPSCAAMSDPDARFPLTLALCWCGEGLAQLEKVDRG